jgi:hypothetical protein
MKTLEHINVTGASCAILAFIRGTLVAAALWVAATFSTYAQTWETVVNLGGQGEAIMIDPFSNDIAHPGIFLGGRNGTESGGKIFHYETSTDELSVIDSSPGRIRRFASDSQGNIFAVGLTSGNTGHWLVMMSLDGGVSWQTIDDAANWHPKFSSSAVGVTIDPQDNVFVSGYALEQRGSSWRVRKGVKTASGYTWTECLKLSGNPAQGGEIRYVPPVQGKHDGGIYAVGHTTPSSVTLWTVMRSSNGGATWQRVDAWSPSTKTAAAANAITSDQDGNIYVVGSDSGRDPSGWWMRRSDDGGANWNLIGPKYSIGSHNQPRAVAADAWGNIFVAGYTGAGGHVNWTVRGWNATTKQWDNWPASVRHPMDPFTSRAEGLAVTALGEVYVTGSANGFGWLVQKLIP